MPNSVAVLEERFPVLPPECFPEFYENKNRTDESSEDGSSSSNKEDSDTELKKLEAAKEKEAKKQAFIEQKKKEGLYCEACKVP